MKYYFDGKYHTIHESLITSTINPSLTVVHLLHETSSLTRCEETIKSFTDSFSYCSVIFTYCATFGPELEMGFDNLLIDASSTSFAPTSPLVYSFYEHLFYPPVPPRS